MRLDIFRRSILAATEIEQKHILGIEMFQFFKDDFTININLVSNETLRERRAESHKTKV